MHQAPQGAIDKMKGLATPLLSLVNASSALLLQVLIVREIWQNFYTKGGTKSTLKYKFTDYKFEVFDT